jgi:hypothetical protein
MGLLAASFMRRNGTMVVVHFREDQWSEVASYIQEQGMPGMVVDLGFAVGMTAASMGLEPCWELAWRG